MASTTNLPLPPRRASAPAVTTRLRGTQEKTCEICDMTASTATCKTCGIPVCDGCYMGNSCDRCRFFDQEVVNPKEKNKPIQALFSSLLSLAGKGATPSKEPTPSKLSSGFSKMFSRRGSSSSSVMRQPSFSTSSGGDAENTVENRPADVERFMVEIENLKELNAKLTAANQELSAHATTQAVPVSKDQTTAELLELRGRVAELQVQIQTAKQEILELGQTALRAQQREAELEAWAQQVQAANASGGGAALPPGAAAVAKSGPPPAPPMPDSPEYALWIEAIQNGTHKSYWDTVPTTTTVTLPARPGSNGNSRTTNAPPPKSTIPPAPPLPNDIAEWVKSQTNGGGSAAAMPPGTGQAPRRGSAPANLGGPLLVKKQNVYERPKKDDVELRGLYWTPIDAQKAQGTIWSQLADKQLPPPTSVQPLLQELSRKFAKKAPAATTAGQGGAGANAAALAAAAAAASSAPRPKILDSTRHQNIGIGLSTFKQLSLSQIRRAVIEYDRTVLTPEFSAKLFGMIPTAEEIKLIDDLRADRALDAAFFAAATKEESFAIEMAGIPRLRQRLQCVMTERNFPTASQEAEQNIHVYSQAIETITKSENWRLFLHLCLETGNYLNDGSKRGGAWGFAMADIAKFAESKSADSKYSLLHWIAEVAATTKPALFDLASDFECVELANTTSLEEIRKDVVTVRRMVDLARKEVEEFRSGPSMSTEGAANFVKHLGPFVDKAVVKAQKLDELIAKLDKDAEALLTMHGEKSPKTCREFFEDVLKGVNLFVKCHEENLALRMAQQKAQQQASREKGAHGVAPKLEGVAKTLEKQVTKDKLSKTLRDTGVATGKARDELGEAMAKRQAAAAAGGGSKA